MYDEIKLAIAVPTSGMVRACFAYSLAGLVARFSQGVPTVPEATLNVNMYVHESSVIHINRERLVRQAIDEGKTHILFIDDDMSFEPQAIDYVMGRRLPVVGVNYCIKEWPITKFVAVGLDGQRIVTRAESTGLVPISYTGFGFCLIETRVFKAVEPPWFQPIYVPEASSYTTEDNPCFEKIRKAGFDCYIDQDASKLVKHVGAFAYSWDGYTKPLPIVGK